MKKFLVIEDDQNKAPVEDFVKMMASFGTSIGYKIHVLKDVVEFEANVRAGAKPAFHPVAYIPIPDDIYGQIPIHNVDDLPESVQRFNVTLTPVGGKHEKKTAS